MVDARTDVELLAATPGEPRAFGVFYGRHERSLLSFFRRCTGSAEVAADLTAETFANALESLPGFRAELGDPGAWLFGIARHVLSRSLERGGWRTGRAAGRAEHADDPRVRRWRGARLSRLALAFSVIPVLAVAAIILTTRGGGAGSQTTRSGTPNSAAVALREAAAAARTGAAAPKLRAGQAWYTASVEVTSDQSFPGVDKPPGASLTTGKSRLAKWITADGTEYEATRGLPGPGRFSSFSSGTPSGPVGFGDWDPFAPQRLPAASHQPEPQAFPAIATAVPRFLAAQHQGYWQYTHGNTELNDTDQSPFTELAQLSAYLGDWPLRPVSRGVAFEAIARLSGLLYLGQTTDPAGRAGLGVAEDATGIAPFELTGRPPPRQSYRFVVILDPKTGAGARFQGD